MVYELLCQFKDIIQYNPDVFPTITDQDEKNLSP